MARALSNNPATAASSSSHRRPQAPPSRENPKPKAPEDNLTLPENPFISILWLGPAFLKGVRHGNYGPEANMVAGLGVDCVEDIKLLLSFSTVSLGLGLKGFRV